MAAVRVRLLDEVRFLPMLVEQLTAGGEKPLVDSVQERETPMSPLRLVLLGLVAGSVAAPQVTTAQVTVTKICIVTVRVCVGTPPVCNEYSQIIPCPSSGAGHVAYKDVPELRERMVKEGSDCVVERKGGNPKVTVHGKSHKGVCEFNHPFP